MAKRKHFDPYRPDDQDYGLGATMAYLRSQGEDLSQPAKKRKQGEPKVARESACYSSGSSRDLPTEQTLPSKDRRTSSFDSSSGAPESHIADAEVEAGDVPRRHSSGPFDNLNVTAQGDQHRSNKSRRKEKSQAWRQGRSGKKSDTRERERERDRDPDGEKSYPAIEYSVNARLTSQISINDLQQLILYVLADAYAPQWLAVRSRASIRQFVVLLVPGLELDMFTGKFDLESTNSVDSEPQVPEESLSPSSETNSAADKKREKKHMHVSPDDYYPAKLDEKRLPAALKPLADIFQHVWPVRAFTDSNGGQFHRVHSPVHSMLTSPISQSREYKQMKSGPQRKGPSQQNAKDFPSKRTPVTEFLASLDEQEENEYAVHSAWFTTPEAKDAALRRRTAAGQIAESGWVDSNVACLEDGDVPDKEIEQGSVSAGKRVLAIDCEMCKDMNNTSVLARVCVLDWNGDVLMDELVKPDVPIKDYLTVYSGITEAMLEHVTTTLSDIQRRLLEMIDSRTILVGHSLNMDLNALKLTHPFIVDTAILYPHQRGPPYKQSLKWLSQKYLHKEIQKGSHGHDSKEDAHASLELVKQKCEHGPGWGTSDMNAESIFKRLGRVQQRGAIHFEERQCGAVVDWGEANRGHGAQASVAIGCGSDEDIVNGIKSVLDGSVERKDGSTGKVDFVWGQLRELELVRGWWDGTKATESHVLTNALKKLRPRSEDDGDEAGELTGPELGAAVAKTVDYIKQVYESLPRCTAFMVYSGTGDPREMRRLQAMKVQYQREYQVKNWDQLSVKWTDTEVQALSQACKTAREGIGFVVVK